MEGTPGEGRRDSVLTEPADIGAQLLALLRQLADESGIAVAPGKIGLDTRLEADLGLDSIGRSELIARVERQLGDRLPDEALLAPTPRDLLKLLQPRPTGAPVAAPGGAAAGEPLEDAATRAQRNAPHALPTAVRSLPELLAWHTEHAPDQVHILLYGDAPDPRPITHSELQQAAARTAGGLQAHGLEPGRTVALMLPTSFDYFASFFGILLAGGIPVPIYPPARPEQLEDHLRRHAGILDNAGAMLLITVWTRR